MNSGRWSEPRAIDLGMPAGLPFVSPDGKYLFFTAGERGKSDIYWVEAGFIDRIIPQPGDPMPKGLPWPEGSKLFKKKRIPGRKSMLCLIHLNK